MTVIRTKEELNRARWAEKYMSVAQGKLYTTEPLTSPFPVHEYFKLGLLGKELKMLEVNAGHALVEQMVADTLTDMTLEIGKDESDAQEQEAREFLEKIDYEDTLESSVRDYFAVGYTVQQPFRLEEGSDPLMTVGNVDPSTWYPVIPAFTHQSMDEARIISVFPEGKEGSQVWYAFVERHTKGKLEYELYVLENADSLEGKPVGLATLAKFSGLKDSISTDLKTLAVFQRSRKKASGYTLGESVLLPIWGMLQEVSEFQTQIRQERIKHFRSKMYAGRRTLSPVDGTQDMTGVDADGTPLKLKLPQKRTPGAQFNANQEVFPIEPGDPPPGYIQWDASIIQQGSQEIDKILSRIAATVGAPRSIFNLDDKGDIHVETEKRKDRKYVRQILQAQTRAAGLVRDVLQTWWTWTKEGEPPPITVTFDSPFEMTQEEKVKVLREMNPDAVMVSEEEAVKQTWPKLKPDEREKLLQQIRDERTMSEPPPNSMLNNVPKVQL